MRVREESSIHVNVELDQGSPIIKRVSFSFGEVVKELLDLCCFFISSPRHWDRRRFSRAVLMLLPLAIGPALFPVRSTIRAFSVRFVMVCVVLLVMLVTHSRSIVPGWTGDG